MPESQAQLNLPKHLVLIPDGNGRWARKHNLPIEAGHLQGAQAIRKILYELQDMDVEVVTIWGFSTENWSRSPEETENIMGVMQSLIQVEGKNLVEKGIKFRHIGRRDRIPQTLLQDITNLEEKTADNQGKNFVLALDYGGRDEIIRAVNKVAGQSVDESSFKEFLDTAGLPDPDLIIRTSGEMRTSGVLPYQSVYAEFVSSPVLLPDFDKEELLKCLSEYSRRQRRFGQRPEPMAQIQTIDQLAKELHEARKETGVKVILGHGAGSFGHPPAAKYRTMEGIVDENSLLGASEVRLAVAELNSIVMKRLLLAEEPAVSLPPGALLTSTDGAVAGIFPDPVMNFLNTDMLPVIYGDVISDEKRGFTIFSGEQVLNLLASNLPKFGLNPKFIVEVGDTDGVYEDLATKVTIPEINESNFSKVETLLSGSSNTDVTGGMAHKVKEAYDLAKTGIPTLLISAAPGNLQKALLGQEVIGTWIR